MPWKFDNALRLTAFLAVALCPARSVRAEAQVIHGTDRFTFSYRVTLPRITGEARIWIPLARSGPFQDVTAQPIPAIPGVRTVRDQSGENEILTMPVTPAESGSSIEIDYTVVRREREGSPAAGDTSPDLRPDRLVPVNETFRALAEKVTAGKPDAFSKGRALFDYVLAEVKYDKSGTGWGMGDAMRACSVRKGNCTDFHSLFIALARSAGIPARFAIGFTIPADRDEGPVSGYHCWAEFLADGRWIPVDISEAWKNPALADYYFGHQPANRFELTRGRDLVVDPAPVSGPINFLIYPLLEIDGRPATAENQFSFHRLKS
jgi:transglutaminase-like putative cysteine protease